MTKVLIKYLSVFVLTFFIISCTVQKRQYNKGIYVHWKKSNPSPKPDLPIHHSLASTSNNQRLVNLFCLLSDSIKSPENCGDSLFLKSGTKMSIKFIRIEGKNIVFKRCSNLKSPELLISVKEISRVKLADGSIIKDFQNGNNSKYQPASSNLTCDSVFLDNGKITPVRFIRFDHDELLYRLPKDNGSHYKVMEIRNINKIKYSNGEVQYFNDIIDKIKSNHTDLKHTETKKLNTLSNISFWLTISYILLIALIFILLVFFPYLFAILGIAGAWFNAINLLNLPNVYYYVASGVIAGLMLCSLVYGKYTMNTIRKSPESKVSKRKAKFAYYFTQTLLIVLFLLTLCTSLLFIHSF